MKIKKMVLFTSFIALLSFSFGSDIISEILIEFQNTSEHDTIVAREYDLIGISDQYCKLFVNEDELLQLQNEGFSILIIHEDVITFWNSRTPAIRPDFAGSIGNRFFSYMGWKK